MCPRPEAGRKAGGLTVCEAIHAHGPAWMARHRTSDAAYASGPIAVPPVLRFIAQRLDLEIGEEV